MSRIPVEPAADAVRLVDWLQHVPAVCFGSSG
jgi:hypothetical protein